MFVSRRACPGRAAWLLGGALVAALIEVRTQIIAEQLDRSQILATCLSKGQVSLVANRSWQYFTGVNLPQRNPLICNLRISVANEDNPFAAHLNPTSSSLMPKQRLLFRVDWLQLQEWMSNARACPSTSYVYLSRSTARSDYLCSRTTDTYAWLDDWLDVTIYPYNKPSILRINASFAVLLAMNVCEAGRIGTAILEVDNVTYAYAPGTWYEQLIQQNSRCKVDRNYTVVARTAVASRLLRVTVLATPTATAIGCRRVCVERHCFVAGNASTSVEAAENVTILYAAVRPCSGVEQIGFTLKLESVLPPALPLSAADGGLSEAGVTALVAALITVVMVVVIVVGAVIVIRKRRLHDGGQRMLRTGKESGDLSRPEAPAAMVQFPPEGCPRMAVTNNRDCLSAMYASVDTKDCSPFQTTVVCNVADSEYCTLPDNVHERVYSQLSAF